MKYKKLSKFLIILTIVFSLLFFIPSIKSVTADSGWDTDYDFDTDFGSDYDYDYDYGYSSSSDFDIPDVIVIIGVIVMIILMIIISKNKPKTKVIITNNNYNYSYTDISEDDLKKFLPSLSIKELKDITYKIFLDVQDAWMNFDYDKIRNLCTDELYNAYKTQLQTLKLKNGKNIMSDFSLKDIKITEISDTNGIIKVEVYMDIEMSDYVINTKTNEVTRGSKDVTMKNHYLMTFVKTDKETSGKVICPNCGAKVDLNTSAKCEYCGSTIVKDAKEFVLSKKKVIK